MAAGQSKATDAFDRELDTLRVVVDKLAKRSARFRRRFAGSSARSSDQVTVLVVGPREVVVRRVTTSAPLDTRALDLRLEGAEIAVQMLSAPPASAEAPALTADERAALEAAGLTAESPPDALDALTRSRIEHALLLRDSLSLERAARDLGVSTGRLRQRLSVGERTLFGFKEGRGWRVPRFQFERRGKLVRGIEKVLPHVAVDAQPLAVRRWFTTPHPDLVVGGEEEPVTPLAWLSAGLPPEPVAELAEEI